MSARECVVAVAPVLSRKVIGPVKRSPPTRLGSEPDAKMFVAAPPLLSRKVIARIGGAIRGFQIL